MCGIFAYLNQYNLIRKPEIFHNVEKNFEKGWSRGPESSEKILLKNGTLFLGFHRLAINGLNNKSNQPFSIEGISLICNGEIYNYHDLFEKINQKNISDSDCEIIIWLYKLYGIEYTLQLLDGVFAFVLYDSHKDLLITARDPYGVRPMYYLQTDSELIFTSELKQIHTFNGVVEQYPPGTYSVYSLSSLNILSQLIIQKKYTSFPFLNNTIDTITMYTGIYSKLFEAVKKRTIGTTDRPIACLLSGGLDSSIITSMVNQLLPVGTLETYSIGLPGSVDLKYAKIVADYLGTKHTTIVLTEEQFFEAIPEVIRAIESYDTTTVRASVGNYLIGKHISKHSKAKVIFNGDGADELTGGYLYFNKCPTHIEFDCETKRLLTDIHMYDVLRSDKSISSHGLEPRTPFLDRGLVEYYLSIDSSIRCHSTNNKCEKYLLRESIEYCNNTLLPKEILTRRKEAFSDGVSSENRSWYKIISEKLNGVSEKEYYKLLFSEYYPGRTNIVKYEWMPKYIPNATDPSARTLAIY
jgi:asparagine synthase (glutamine-hydrolysing)